MRKWLLCFLMSQVHFQHMTKNMKACEGGISIEEYKLKQN